MSRWLDIVGVTEAGVASLGAAQKALIADAAVVIGVPRRLETIAPREGRELLVWDGNIDTMVVRILGVRHRPTVLLASGDPNWFGIGATLARHLPAEEFALHPVPSSFQLAAAQMRWPMQNVATLSLHGRPVALLHPHVAPGNRILALTSDGTTPAQVGALLVSRGYGSSLLTVLEDLGGAGERVHAFPAREAADHSVGDFHVLAVDCVADDGAPLLPSVPGLPDSAFDSDGQLTKREVRAATLASLAPYPGALLWDVGAGSGSIAIEWMRAARDARAFAFERNPARVAAIRRNCDALGVPGLAVIEGEAPQCLVDQPRPDALFLGGGTGDSAVFEACWAALKPGGRFVANAVTLDAEAALFDRQTRFGGDLTRIHVERLEPIGAERAFRPRMTVTQWSVTKEGE